MLPRYKLKARGVENATAQKQTLVKTRNKAAQILNFSSLTIITPMSNNTFVLSDQQWCGAVSYTSAMRTMCIKFEISTIFRSGHWTE